MVNTEGCPPGHAAHPLGAQGPGPPASALCQVGVGGCRAGGHSAARAQDPRRRPGCWGELGPRPPSTQSTHRPPCRAPKGHGGFREHGREDPVCHGELWQPCLWTVAARDHQTLPDARLPSSWCPWESACRSSQPPKGACQLWGPAASLTACWLSPQNQHRYSEEGAPRESDASGRTDGNKGGARGPF